MKKYCLFVILLFMSVIMPLNASEVVLINDEKYSVVDVLEDGTFLQSNQYDTYEEANTYYEEQASTANNLIIVQLGKILKAEYAVVNFNGSGDCSTNTTFTKDITNESGYTNSCYGGDGAYIDTSEDGAFVKFRLSGVDAWAKAEDVTIIPIEKASLISSYQVKNDKLYHRIKTRYSEVLYSSTIYLGEHPTYLKDGKEYYSFDGHYFYDKDHAGFQGMIDDYRNGSVNNALNTEDVYYNYYQFLPHRSTTQYTNEDVKNYFENYLSLRKSMTSFKDTTYNGIHNILNDSMLYGEQDAFFQYEREYGANALMMLSLAMNESAVGRSSLAYTRNNLFGHAAFDSDVENNASRYASVASSISSHAKNYISLSYANPNEYVFHGSYFGNKSSGMNVSYASDPYWGEKAAQYYAKIDDALGNKDLHEYALGIHASNSNMKIYKDAKNDADTLYEIDEKDAIFVILQKQVNKDGTWYKVQSEQVVDDQGRYDFKQQVGYVKTDDITYVLNEDKIGEKNYHTVTFDAGDGKFQNGYSKLTLQVEDGSVPVMVAPVKDQSMFSSWDKDLTKASEDTLYQAVYKTIVDVNMNAMPKTVYQLEESLDCEGGTLAITYEDGTKETIALTASMVANYDRKTAGTQTLEVTYGGSRINYEIEVKEASADKDEVAASFNELISTLKDKETFTQDEIQSIVDLKKALDQSNIKFTYDDKRQFDILYGKINPMKVYINDNGRNLGVSGLPLSLDDETLDSKLKVAISDSVDDDQKKILQQVADGNEYTVIDFFSMDVSFDDKELYTPLVISIDKPADALENQVFTVLALHDDNVERLHTTQSGSHIIFETDTFQDFVIVSKDSDAVLSSNDVMEVHTEDGNPVDCVKYIAIAVGGIVILGAGIACILRYRNIKGYKKKHPRG